MHRHPKVTLLAGVVGAARTHAGFATREACRAARATWQRLHRETGSSGVGGAHSTGETE